MIFPKNCYHWIVWKWINWRWMARFRILDQTSHSHVQFRKRHVIHVHWTGNGPEWRRCFIGINFRWNADESGFKAIKEGLNSLQLLENIAGSGQRSQRKRFVVRTLSDASSLNIFRKILRLSLRQSAYGQVRLTRRLGFHGSRTRASTLGLNLSTTRVKLRVCLFRLFTVFQRNFYAAFAGLGHSWSPSTSKRRYHNV